MRRPTLLSNVTGELNKAIIAKLALWCHQNEHKASSPSRGYFHHVDLTALSGLKQTHLVKPAPRIELISIIATSDRVSSALFALH